MPSQRKNPVEVLIEGSQFLQVLHRFRKLPQLKPPQRSPLSSNPLRYQTCFNDKSEGTKKKTGFCDKKMLHAKESASMFKVEWLGWISGIFWWISWGTSYHSKPHHRSPTTCGFKALKMPKKNNKKGQYVVCLNKNSMTSGREKIVVSRWLVHHWSHCPSRVRALYPCARTWIKDLGDLCVFFPKKLVPVKHPTFFEACHFCSSLILDSNRCTIITPLPSTHPYQYLQVCATSSFFGHNTSSCQKKKRVSTGFSPPFRVFQGAF